LFVTGSLFKSKIFFGGPAVGTKTPSGPGRCLGGLQTGFSAENKNRK